MRPLEVHLDKNKHLDLHHFRRDNDKLKNSIQSRDLGFFSV